MCNFVEFKDLVEGRLNLYSKRGVAKRNLKGLHILLLIKVRAYIVRIFNIQGRKSVFYSSVCILVVASINYGSINSNPPSLFLFN